MAEDEDIEDAMLRTVKQPSSIREVNPHLDIDLALQILR